MELSAHFIRLLAELEHFRLALAEKAVDRPLPASQKRRIFAAAPDIPMNIIIAITTDKQNMPYRMVSNNWTRHTCVASVLHVHAAELALLSSCTSQTLQRSLAVLSCRFEHHVIQ